MPVSRRCRRRRDRRRHCVVSIAIVAVLHNEVGFFTYTTFFGKTQAFVPDNYPVTDDWATVARVLIVGMIISGIPYSSYLPRLALSQLVDSVIPTHSLSPKKQKIQHVILSLLVPLGALCIAEVVHDLGVVLTFLGGFSATGLGFIMPPAVFLSLGEHRWFHREKLPYAAVFLFGVFCIIITIATTIISIVKSPT